MAKKKASLEEEIETKEEVKIEPIQTAEEAEIVVIEEIQPTNKKENTGTPYKILNIIKGEFILIDGIGNGVMISIPNKYKQSKVGEIIYL